MNRNDVPTANTIDTKNTAAAGANWTAFDDAPCHFVRFHNPSAVVIEYRLNGGGDSVQVPAYSVRTIYGVDNASKVSMRRLDQSNTQVAVQIEALN